MPTRILDLDGSLTAQPDILRQAGTVIPLADWGPRIRMGCSHASFRNFEAHLHRCLGEEASNEPTVTFYGSGDFHHVSLALLRRLNSPFNLLLLDNHPDWMRGVPFLHCGTWLYHAAQLPNVRSIFHVGGNDDFDDFFRWLAPWPMLRSGKIKLFPAVRRFEAGSWRGVAHQPLRLEQQRWLLEERLDYLLKPHQPELASYPLYISLDKDVLIEADATSNWPAGRLTLAELQMVLEAFLTAVRGNVLGADVTGDWSPVRVRGWLRRLLHVTEHPAVRVDADQACRRNESTNMVLLETIRQAPERSSAHTVKSAI